MVLGIYEEFKGGEGGICRREACRVENEMERRHNMTLERDRVQHKYIHKSNECCRELHR